MEWRDYGNVLIYQQVWGGSSEDRECVKVESRSSLPKYCRCLDCGARIKIADVEINC